jgi:polyisoprenoid-binding protein YceI
MSIDSTSTSIATTALPAIAAGTYTIDASRTRVRFTVKELWGLVTVGGTVAVREGTIVVAADPRRSTVRAELDPATFDSGNKRRDKDVTGKNFLDVAAHPTISFASTGLRAGTDGWTISGTLNIHGIDAPALLRLDEARTTKDGCYLTGSTVVDRTVFGVSRAAGFIARQVAVTIEVFATAA